MSYEEYTVRVYPDGDKEWYQNGDPHRLDGPAVEHANGDKYWYIKGLEYSKEAFEQKIREMNNPTKEMTVEQIAKELGYKVKVIEG